MERRFLALGMLLFSALLKALTPRKPTPAQTERPFYPVVAIPLRDNLMTHPDKLAGRPLRLYGRVLDTAGNPLSGIKIEIWQCDGQGIYDHPNQTNQEKLAPGVTGCGVTLTQADERYQFQPLYQYLIAPALLILTSSSGVTSKSC